MTDPQSDFTLAGVALLVLYIVIKDIVRPLIERSNGKSGGVHRMIADLWQWHAPDDGGEQSWKGKRIEVLLSVMNENFKEQTVELRRHNQILNHILHEQIRIRDGAAEASQRSNPH